MLGARTLALAHGARAVRLGGAKAGQVVDAQRAGAANVAARVFVLGGGGERVRFMFNSIFLIFHPGLGKDRKRLMFRLYTTKKKTNKEKRAHLKAHALPVGHLVERARSLLGVVHVPQRQPDGLVEGRVGQRRAETI